MKNDKRIEEIISQIEAFNKPSYTKEEFLPELLKLQEELVKLTYNSDHAENSDLKLWDVERHLRELNDERNNIAAAELQEFTTRNKDVINTIKAEFSGNMGESKVFGALERLVCDNVVLKNIELSYNGRRTEIDAIVLTPKAIFILEVKNSRKDVYIDENGDFFRCGYSMAYDCNIADKMNEREALLCAALEKNGFKSLHIVKLLVFTNKSSNVENKYRDIKICYSNIIPSYIERYSESADYEVADINEMALAINNEKCNEPYKMAFDMTEYISSFAVLMAKLESAETVGNSEDVYDCENEKEVKTPRNPFNIGKGMVAAAIGFTLLNASIIGLNMLTRK